MSALNTLRGPRGTRQSSGRGSAAGRQPVIVRRRKQNIATANQDPRNLGNRRRDSGHKAGQQGGALELGD